MTNGSSAGGGLWERQQHLNGDSNWGGMWIFDTVNKSWRLLNHGSNERGDGQGHLHVPNQISPHRAMTFSKDDDVFMVLGGTSDLGVGGTWFYDVYMNTWYRPTGTPWGSTGPEYGLSYDTKNKKYLMLSASYQKRNLWVYDSSTNTWSREGGWYQTSLTQAITARDQANGVNSIKVANATGAQVGGSVLICAYIGSVDGGLYEAGGGGHTAYIPLDIVGVHGNTILVSNGSNYWGKISITVSGISGPDDASLSLTPRKQLADLNYYLASVDANTWTLFGPKATDRLSRSSFVSNVNSVIDPGILSDHGSYGGDIRLNTQVNIYPPTWPPYALGGYLNEAGIEGAGPSIGTVIGVNGVYDDIHDKHLFFIPRRDRNRFEVWAYDLGSHTWEHKTSSPADMSTHRAGDGPAQWMHKNNAAVIADLASAQAGGPKIRYYRYSTGNLPAIEPPQSLTATVNSNCISLSWDAVPGAIGYYVYRARGSHSYGLTYSKINGGNLVKGISFSDSNVSSGANYYYRVSAYNGPAESDKSYVARGISKLIWDGYVSTTDTSKTDSNRFSVNWMPRDRNVKGYNIYRSQCAAIYYPKQGQPYSTGSNWKLLSGNVYYHNMQGDLGDPSFNFPVDTVKDSLNNAFTKVGYLSLITGPHQYCQNGMNLYAWLDHPGESLTYTLKQAYNDFLYVTDVLKSCVPVAWTKITTGGCASPISAGSTSCTDTADMTGGKQYAYRVTSVNKLNVESGPSPFWITVPGAPRHLNWKTTPSESSLSSGSYTVKLRWDANPESGLQGYHVYRKSGTTADANGLYLTRLTSHPVGGTEYTDTLPYNYKNIGYYVVAVDSLGQEGIPSSRALVNRSFLNFWTSQGYLTDYNSGIGFGPP